MPPPRSPSFHSLSSLSLFTGEGVFDTIPIEADYTVGDMKLWLKTHKNKVEHTTVRPKNRKMGAGSEVLGDDIVIADVMDFEGKWLMQLSLFRREEQYGEMESTFETIGGAAAARGRGSPNASARSRGRARRRLESSTSNNVGCRLL